MAAGPHGFGQQGGAGGSLSRNPQAPAFSAPYTYSSRSKVVTTTTRSGSATSGFSGQQAGGFQPIQFGHPDVQQANVRSKLSGQPDGRFPRRRPRRRL